MNGRTTAGVFGGLLLLVAVETGLAFTPVPRLVLPAIGLGMVAVVALTAMRLRAGGVLAAVFAMAGLFWLSVMMGLGSMDAATRTDIPVTRTDVRMPSGGMPIR